MAIWTDVDEVGAKLVMKTDEEINHWVTARFRKSSDSLLLATTVINLALCANCSRHSRGQLASLHG